MAFIREKYSGNRWTFRGQHDDTSGHTHRARPPDRGGPGPLATIISRGAWLRGHDALRLERRLPLGRRLPPSHRAQHLGGARRAANATGHDRAVALIHAVTRTQRG